MKPKDALGAYGYDDRVAFHQAFADVRPLPRRKQPVVGGPDPEREAVRARAAEVDASARARLEALVAEGVRFVVERDSEGGVAGRRVNVADRVLDALYGSKLSPTRRLDLHGMVADDARRAIVAFVREHQDRGARDVLLVHGKGLHSEGGSGVLGEVVVQALTTSAAAVRVEAFITAPARLGGAGATLVRLAPRTAS